MANRFAAYAALALAASILPAAAVAQTPARTGSRAAVSSRLTTDDVAAAFADAVVKVCAPAVLSGRRLSALDAETRRMVAATNDPAARQQAGAEKADQVWDVLAGRGVVTIAEREGRCTVSAYGPPAAPALAAAAERLEASGQGFERLFATPNSSSVNEALVHAAPGHRVQATMTGAEPGMPNHRSRFSVISATIFAMPG